MAWAAVTPDIGIFFLAAIQDGNKRAPSATSYLMLTDGAVPHSFLNHFSSFRAVPADMETNGGTVKRSENGRGRRETFHFCLTDQVWIVLAKGSCGNGFNSTNISLFFLLLFLPVLSTERGSIHQPCKVE